MSSAVQRFTALRSAPSSDSFEVLLDLAAAQAQHHGTAVRTDRRIRGGPQLLEDVRHLLAGQRIVGLHRGVASGGGGNPPQRLLHLRAAVEAVEIGGERLQSLRAVLY